MRDPDYSPFAKTSPEPRRAEVVVFVLARQRGEVTDSMRGSMRTSPHGCEVVYLLNGELYQSQLCANEALARADLAAHADALTAAGWRPVPFKP